MEKRCRPGRLEGLGTPSAQRAHGARFQRCDSEHSCSMVSTVTTLAVTPEDKGHGTLSLGSTPGDTATPSVLPADLAFVHSCIEGPRLVRSQSCPLGSPRKLDLLAAPTSQYALAERDIGCGIRIAQAVEQRPSQKRFLDATSGLVRSRSSTSTSSGGSTTRPERNSSLDATRRVLRPSLSVSGARTPQASGARTPQAICGEPRVFCSSGLFLQGGVEVKTPSTVLRPCAYPAASPSALVPTKVRIQCLQRGTGRGCRRREEVIRLQATTLQAWARAALLAGQLPMEHAAHSPLLSELEVDAADTEAHEESDSIDDAAPAMHCCDKPG